MIFAHVVCRPSSHTQNSCIYLKFTHNQQSKQILICASVWNRYLIMLVCRTDICSASKCKQIFIHASTVNRYLFILAVHMLEISSLLDFCSTVSSLFNSYKSLDKVYSSYTVHCKQDSHRVLFSMSLNKTVSAALMTWVERFSSGGESLLVHCFTWHTELSAHWWFFWYGSFKTSRSFQYDSFKISRSFQNLWTPH